MIHDLIQEIKRIYRWTWWRKKERERLSDRQIKTWLEGIFQEAINRMEYPITDLETGKRSAVKYFNEILEEK